MKKLENATSEEDNTTIKEKKKAKLKEKINQLANKNKASYLKYAISFNGIDHHKEYDSQALAVENIPEHNSETIKGYYIFMIKYCHPLWVGRVIEKAFISTKP